MNQISIKHLRYFSALAQYSHFGHAAEACAISQPALSVQIKELENILGAPLVERGSRQIHLTRLGQDLALRAQDILRAVDELEDFARAQSQPLAGVLRIGIIPTVAPYLLPQIIRQLEKHYPQLDLRPREAFTRKLIEELIAGKLDAAIMALPASEPTLTETPLFDEEFVLVRPEKDKNKPVPSAKMLRDMRLLLLEEGHCFRDQALSFCKISPALSRDMMEGSSLSTLVQLVGAGMGVTLIPDMAVAVETHAAQVSVSRLPAPCPSRTIGMVWRKTTPLAKEMKKMADVIRQIRTEPQP